jgi:hypothetical protein
MVKKDLTRLLPIFVGTVSLCKHSIFVGAIHCLCLKYCEIFKYTSFAEFEVLTAVVMMNSIFWDITLCRLVEANRCF